MTDADKRAVLKRELKRLRYHYEEALNRVRYYDQRIVDLTAELKKDSLEIINEEFAEILSTVRLWETLHCEVRLPRWRRLRR